MNIIEETPVVIDEKEGAVDKMGIVLSGLCLIDCVALPILSAAYTFADILEFFHVAIFFIVAPLGVIASIRGYRRHKKPWIVALILSGLSIMAVSALGHDLFHVHIGVFELHTLLSVLGSAVLITGHWNNLKFMGCAIPSFLHRH